MNNNDFFKFNSRMIILRDVIESYNPALLEDLNKKSIYWAPESQPIKYTEWVNNNFLPDPTNIVSVLVYSILMDKTFADTLTMMRQNFSKNNAEDINENPNLKP